MPKYKLITRLPGGVMDEQPFEHRIEAENAAEEFARSGFFSTLWGLKGDTEQWGYLCEFASREGVRS